MHANAHAAGRYGARRICSLSGLHNGGAVVLVGEKALLGFGDGDDRGAFPRQGVDDLTWILDRLDWRCFQDFVILVFDRETRCATEADHALCAVLGGKPEIIDLDILVSDFSLLDPERWVLAGLSLNANDSEILRVDPNLSTIEELVLSFRQQVEDVPAAFGSVLESGELKVVILAG